MPHGVSWLRNVSCVPNQELGLSHARLPVTHVHDRLPQRAGLWFYYARGCSDLTWHVGRTLRARNRYHATVLLHQRLFNTSYSAAIERVTRTLRSRNMLGRRGEAALLAEARRHLGAWLVRELARGIFGSHRAECNASPRAVGGTCVGACLRRAMGLSRALQGQNALFDRYNAELMQRLSGSDLELDTLQLEQQPQGGGSTLWATEIWDRRRIDLRNTSRLMASQRIGRLDGALCVPSRISSACLSCDKSELERRCLERDMQPHCAPRSRARRSHRCGSRVNVSFYIGRAAL